ncbi:MAG: Uma2 family endonuclease [Planctomycetes bacterium]|nr:Uma2 family endonuclease [Planctomycetota bacterium]
MVTFIADGAPISVPEWVVDIESFRRWIDADDFPEQGRIWWLKGEVLVDMSREQIFTHLAVKNEFSFVLTGLVKVRALGLFLPDGLLLSNFAADICGNPDATFISQETLRSDRVRLIEGVDGGYVELQGAPDMVLEVISRSSEKKDTVVLKKAYWEAGIPEYWLVDARQEPLKFDILRHTSRGYVAARKPDGWAKSAVFGKSFRLTRRTNELGHPEFTLAVR